MSDFRQELTREGYEELKRELENLMEKRNAFASELGDIRNDIGEDEALEFEANIQRERLDERISYLRSVLANPIIIDEDPEPGKVSLGNAVTVEDNDGEEFTLTVLSRAEIASGKRGISVDSPAGKALLGQAVGDTVKVNAPDGIIKYTIKAID